jgi:hypothetical protein
VFSFETTMMSPGSATWLSAAGIPARSVIYSERAISDLLRALSFSYISGRPQHPRQDQRVLEGFKKTSPARSQPT